MQEGKLFVFSAPSGSGKTTLVQHLLTQELPLGFSVSATSREPRGDEINGTDYHFLSLADFRQKIAESWVESMNDSYARNDWGWKEEFDLPAMTKDMIHNLYKIKNKGTSEYDEKMFL